MSEGIGAIDTRTKLLTAAERILVEQGLTGLSVRKVGDVAGVNPTLVTYHFKTIANLLDELCRRNLAPIVEAWARIGSPETEGAALDDILRDWLSPMLAPAAYTPGGRALVVLDEIAAHGEERLRDRVLTAMEEFSRRLRLALAPHCPELPDDDLRARLRFISGAVLGPPPRSHGAPATGGGRALDDLDFLLPFARSALGR